MLVKTLPFLSYIVCIDHMINGDVLLHETYLLCGGAPTNAIALLTRSSNGYYKG